MGHDSLNDYRRKRHLGQTPEPAGEGLEGSAEQPRFVVQKHRSRRLHYDLRLEMEGVLRSWAVPKGPSMDPSEKRLAINVEDHPLEYIDFEGVIPEGEYGAGQVIVWDQGSYACIGAEVDPVRAWKKGMIDFRLYGQKLRGMWLLVKLKKDENQWLLFKKQDAYATAADVTVERPESVISGFEVEEIEEGTLGTWHSRVQRLLEELQIPPRAIEGEKVRPMLATLVTQVPADSRWICELKYDGIRALAEKKTTNSVSIRAT
ncbi:MAG: DNA polymerase ligase N-terminal domain-containing protein [Acidobacteriota bacterium]